MNNEKEYVNAPEDINREVILNSNSAKAYNSRGLVKSNLNDINGAIEDYTKAIEIDPKYSEAYYNRGVANLDLHNLHEAYLDWNKAGELGNTKALDLLK